MAFLLGVKLFIFTETDSCLPGTALNKFIRPPPSVKFIPQGETIINQNTRLKLYTNEALKNLVYH